MNPMDYMKVFGLWNKFKANHPKFPAFLKAASQSGLKVGTIMEIKITTADGEIIESNLKVTESDMELVEEFKQMSTNMQ